jgi:hypothetical protein
MFLEQLAEKYPDHLNVIQLDNGKFHQSSRLKIPDNILLNFQPPYSPELNPIERIWLHIKQELSWGIYENLDGLKEKVCAFLEEVSTEEIASIAGWDYILSALATVAKLWRIGIRFPIHKGALFLFLRVKVRFVRTKPLLATKTKQP